MAQDTSTQQGQAGKLRAACLRLTSGRHKILFFDPSAGDDEWHAATREALKWERSTFTVEAILPDGVDPFRYIERRNKGVDTTLCQDRDGNWFYVEWLHVGEPYSRPYPSKGAPAG